MWTGLLSREANDWMPQREITFFTCKGRSIQGCYCIRQYFGHTVHAPPVSYLLDWKSCSRIRRLHSELCWEAEPNYSCCAVQRWLNLLLLISGGSICRMIVAWVQHYLALYLGFFQSRETCWDDAWGKPGLLGGSLCHSVLHTAPISRVTKPTNNLPVLHVHRQGILIFCLNQNPE